VIDGFAGAASAQVYRYSGTDLTKIVRVAGAGISKGRLVATYPANSITLFVIPKAPAKPAGGRLPGPAPTLALPARADVPARRAAVGAA
jgi:hypothetical protein